MLDSWGDIMKELILSEIKKATATNRVSREELVKITGRTDRSVRRTIDELRKEGEPIFSDPYSKGYYYSTDMKDYLKFRAIIESKRKEENQQLFAIFKTLRGYV